MRSAAGCPGFEAKALRGPLSKWCRLCGAHLDAHGNGAAASQSAAQPNTFAAPVWSAALGPSKSADSAHTESGRAAVFDFDRTLAIKHVGIFDLGSEIQERLFGGASRCQLLDAMLRDLRKGGCTCFVITRNSSHVVDKALAAVGLRSHFAAIIGNEVFDFDEKKSDMIRAHIMGKNNLSPSDIIFVDDSATEVSDVRENVGCRVVHAAIEPATGGGMSQEDCSAVLDWLSAAG